MSHKPPDQPQRDLRNRPLSDRRSPTASAVGRSHEFSKHYTWTFTASAWHDFFATTLGGGHRDAGDPVELARLYDAEGADELTFLDVTASSGDRETTFDVVRRTAEQVFIPLTVGGGVRTNNDVNRLLRTGADKVSINTAAIARPEFLHEASRRFGSQCIVLSVDARRVPEGNEPTASGFEVTTHGGRKGTGIDAVEWAARGEELGVGEILLNSMDADGTKSGFDLELIELVRKAVRVPVIASGGAGALEHFLPAVRMGADAVLAASVFHFGQLKIGEVKGALRAGGVEVR
jgi:cyclase